MRSPARSAVKRSGMGVAKTLTATTTGTRRRMTKMKNSGKIVALIEAYIELAQTHSYNDSQIIDALTDIFDREELEELGYAEFIRSYFEED